MSIIVTGENVTIPLYNPQIHASPSFIFGCTGPSPTTVTNGIDVVCGVPLSGYILSLVASRVHDMSHILSTNMYLRKF